MWYYLVDPPKMIRITFSTIFMRSLSTLGSPSSSSSKPLKESQPTTAAAVKTNSYESKATPLPPKQFVGPGASKTEEYKNPEYYCYNGMSYFDLEAEMVQHRLPQPTADNEHF